MSRGNALAQTGATHFDAQLGLIDKTSAIKWFVWMLVTLDLLKGLAPICYQPSSEVLISM